MRAREEIEKLRDAYLSDLKRLDEENEDDLGIINTLENEVLLLRWVLGEIEL